MVVAFALSRGLTRPEIESVTELPRIALANPGNRLPDDIIHKLWQRLAEREPNKSLPLRMASRAPFGQFAQVYQHAKNLREAIVFFCRNGKIVSDRLVLQFTESHSSGFLSVRHPMDELDEGRMAIFSMAFFKRVVDGIVSSPIKLNEFRCAYRAPGSLGDYERYFGCATCFDASETGLVFPRRSLEEPLRFANSEIYDFYHEYFDQVLQSLGHSTQLNDFERLQEAVAENARIGIFDSSSAALAAHMSQRNAQRIAAKHDTSLKDLIREIRISMAKELVRNPNFTLEEVAEFLGYADESSFRRAFKTWTGKTPPAFRNGT